MKRCGGILAGACGALVLLGAVPTAQAMRYVQIRIFLNQREVLRTSKGNSGHEDAATMWRYLNELPLRSVNGYSIRPDAGQPLRATLKGPLRLECPPQVANVRELRLVRDAPTGKWRVAPSEVERTLGLTRKGK